MAQGGGFFSAEQETHFNAAGALHRRGGPNEVLCGARTRTGGHCQGKPLIGSRRCLKHAGPHAARAFRARQLRDLARGKITPEEFTACEARRAANRLHDNWKKNPWLPGKTIDLGEHELSFQQQSGLAYTSKAIAPAVLDWLRWKYRRLQIDRKRDAEWNRVLREEYPRRVECAGTPTMEDIAIIAQNGASALVLGAQSAIWTSDRAAPFSKRKKLDLPKSTRPEAVLPLPGASKKVARAMPPPEEVAMMCVRHGTLLNRLFEKCRDDAEKQAVIATLHAYEVMPQDLKVFARWAETVRLLNNRTS
jgi:hypothetical protein